MEKIIFYFEEKYPEDQHPSKALTTLREWIETGEFSMKNIRKASLDAHVAVREVGEDNATRSATRAAGQTVATDHGSIDSFISESFCRRKNTTLFC